MVSSSNGPVRRKRLLKPCSPSARVSGAPSTYFPCPAVTTSQPCARSSAIRPAGAAAPVATTTRWPCCASDGGSAKSRLALAIATAGCGASPFALRQAAMSSVPGCVPTCRMSASSRSEEHTSELQSQFHLVCRLLLEKKKKKTTIYEYKSLNEID